MRSYLEISRNTVSSILRSKVLYVLLFLAILVGLFSILPFMIMQMASEAGEADALRRIQEQSVTYIFGMWSLATFSFALFLGATAISSEVKAKTIVTVLAKPIDRWRFLLAKWLGIETFLLAFFAAGVLIVAIVVLVFEAHVSTLFWVGLVRSFISVTILGASALALSTVASPVFSGGLPILFSMLTGFSTMAMDHPSPVLRTVARGFYLLMPAPMPGNLISQGFDAEPLDPDWGLYGQVLLENACYALVLLGLACAVFNARELRLK